MLVTSGRVEINTLLFGLSNVHRLTSSINEGRKLILISSSASRNRITLGFSSANNFSNKPRSILLETDSALAEQAFYLHVSKVHRYKLDSFICVAIYFTQEFKNGKL